MLSADCLISIPFAAAGSWLLDVLAEHRIQGVAPQLSIDCDEFLLKISSGAGQTFIGEDWKSPVAARLTGHLRIAEAVDRFESDPHNYILRSQMVDAIALTSPVR